MHFLSFALFVQLVRFYSVSMSAQVEKVFENLAIESGVSESDYLVLAHHGYSTCDSFYYRNPTATDLEDTLKEVVVPHAGFQDSSGISIFPRPNQESWVSFRKSMDAAAIRKLWAAAKKLSTKETDEMTEEQQPGVEKKISTVVQNSMIAKAIGRGDLKSRPPDSEIPGRSTLSSVQGNHGVGGQHKFLQWEIFLSQEEESRQERLGL